MDYSFVNKFECRRKLEMYSNGLASFDLTVHLFNSAIAGYLIGNQDNSEKLKNLKDCRDWLLLTKPSPFDVKGILL